MSEVDISKPSTAQGKKGSKIPTRMPPPPSGQSSRAKPPEGKTAVVGGGSPVKTRTRHASGKERKAGGIHRSSSKENLPPASAKKLNPKSNMSYMELKKRHQDLASEVQVLGQKSKETEEQHLTDVRQLAEEIRHYKESNTALRQEIKSYQTVIDERNRLLDGLQQRLEEIKFENERLAAVLEGAKLDAVTGERIKRAASFQSRQHQTEFDLQTHEESLDAFISSLVVTITTLQEQKQKVEQS